MTVHCDPAIASLDPDQRAVLADLWQQRADSESSVRTVFEQVVRELASVRAHADVIALARRASDDERRHAETCAELAAAYRGHSMRAPVVPAVRLPDYTSNRALRVALHVVNLCCIGETIATAFVEACLHDCESDALRDVHRRHLADEVVHARIGWAHVASLGEDERTAIAERLPEILAAQLRTWESRIGELPEDGVRGHGYPPRAVLIAAIRDAVRDLVLPGFAHVGIDTSRCVVP